MGGRRDLHRGFYSVGGGGVVADDWTSQPAGTQLTDDPNWTLRWDDGATQGRFNYRSGGGIEAVTAPTGPSRRLISRGTVPVDHYVQARYTNAGEFSWVAGRIDDLGNAYYAFYGGSFAGIYRLTAGAFEILDSTTPSTPADALIRLECNGSTIRMLIDGVEEISVNDGNHITQTEAGVGTSGTGGQLADFEMGPL